MPKKALRNARAGSLPEPEASASSPDVSSFLQTLTDRQLQVMLSGLHQMFTRDEMTRLNMDIDKIVTTVSVKAIIPALCQSLNVDARCRNSACSKRNPERTTVVDMQIRTLRRVVPLLIWVDPAT
ncbi:hypothetical protein MHYP_G00104360 [Metynnis hypsauchen]